MRNFESSARTQSWRRSGRRTRTTPEPALRPPWPSGQGAAPPSGRRAGGQAGPRETSRLCEPSSHGEHRRESAEAAPRPDAARSAQARQRSGGVRELRWTDDHRLWCCAARGAGETTEGEYTPCPLGRPVRLGVKARVLYLSSSTVPTGARGAIKRPLGCHLRRDNRQHRRECADSLMSRNEDQAGNAALSDTDAAETGEVNKKLAYCTWRATPVEQYAARTRGRTAIDEIKSTAGYRGTCVHEGLLAYTHYKLPERCAAGTCCASHLLRGVERADEGVGRPLRRCCAR